MFEPFACVARTRRTAHSAARLNFDFLQFENRRGRCAMPFRFLARFLAIKDRRASLRVTMYIGPASRALASAPSVGATSPTSSLECAELPADDQQKRHTSRRLLVPLFSETMSPSRVAFARYVLSLIDAAPIRVVEGSTGAPLCRRTSRCPRSLARAASFSYLRSTRVPARKSARRMKEIESERLRESRGGREETDGDRYFPLPSPRVRLPSRIASRCVTTVTACRRIRNVYMAGREGAGKGREKSGLKSREAGMRSGTDM